MQRRLSGDAGGEASQPVGSGGIVDGAAVNRRGDVGLDFVCVEYRVGRSVSREPANAAVGSGRAGAEAARAAGTGVGCVCSAVVVGNPDSSAYRLGSRSSTAATPMSSAWCR